MHECAPSAVATRLVLARAGGGETEMRAGAMHASRAASPAHRRHLRALLTTVALVRPAGAQSDCVDDPGFKLEGIPCARWAGTNCHAAHELLGYTEAEEAGLLAACSAACRVCGTDPLDAGAQPTPLYGCSDDGEPLPGSDQGHTWCTATLCAFPSVHY